MLVTLEESREKFFSAVCRDFPLSKQCRLLLVTHLLEDRPALVRILSVYCSIGSILGIPYSVVPRIRELLSSAHTVAVHSLPEMLDRRVMFRIAAGLIEAAQSPVAIMEIGGYFAPIGNDLRAKYGTSFLGVVEDTENGHKRYEENQPLHFPVVSIARSSLKLVEDKLIGSSIVFSLERFLREMGQVLTGASVGVLGYGRIGSGVARAAAARGARVAVFDKSSIRRALAIADGFSCPDREIVLRKSDLLIGVTGAQSIGMADFHLVRSGAVLASGSSKQLEFDIQALEGLAVKKDESVDIARYRLPDGPTFYLLREGKPLNFRDGAVVGAAISLTQAELIVALRTLVELQDRPGIACVSAPDQDRLANLWLEHFVDIRESGAPLMNLDFVQ